MGVKFEAEEAVEELEFILILSAGGQIDDKPRHLFEFLP